MAALGTLVPASPLDANDGVRHTFTASVTTDTASFTLGDTPADLDTMDTLLWQVDYAAPSYVDDNFGLNIRIVNGATILAAADAGGTFANVATAFTNTADVLSSVTGFAYVNTGASKATWDGASVELNATVNKSKGWDGPATVDYVAITGTYTVAVASITYFQTVIGSVTSTGTQVRSIEATRTGVLTASGAQTRLINVNRTGAVTATGSVLKNTFKGLVGSITSSGLSLQQLVLTQSVAGVLTLSGLVSKTINKIGSGVITMLGAPQKLVTALVEGSMSLTGVVAKAINKAVQGSVTMLGAVLTQLVILRLVEGSLTPSGLLAKTINVVKGGVVTVTGDVVKLVIAIRQGSITLSSTLIKLSTRVIIGTLTLTGIVSISSVVKQLLQGSTTLSSVLSGVITAPPVESAKKFIKSYFNYIKR